MKVACTVWVGAKGVEAPDLSTFLQIKEKYNSLRWYASGTTEEIEKIISKYSDLCRKTCTRCGRPAKWITRYGWIESYCDECFRKEFDVDPEDTCYDLEKEDED